MNISGVRLYSLRKWFRKQAHQAGFEVVQFWMGHVVKQGQEGHYRPKDVEWHRELYRSKAMPFLRLEKSSPLEHETVIQKQQEEIERLKTKMNRIGKQLTELMDKLEESMKEDERVQLEFRHYFLESFGSKLMRKGVARDTIVQALEEFIKDQKKRQNQSSL